MQEGILMLFLLLQCVLEEKGHSRFPQVYLLDVLPQSYYLWVGYKDSVGLFEDEAVLQFFV
jgi:hypothetical protein